MTKQEKYDKFLDSLFSEDMYFSTGDIDADMAQIQGVIKVQGYWAGNQFRYYYDEDFNLLRWEERKFGNV